jgi:hypothetical protein
VKHEGWAIIIIDTDIGFFSVVSDWGNYAYLWSSPGCEFRKFLIGLEVDYLHGKLMQGRPDKEVFDGCSTRASVRGYLIEHNQEVIDETGVPWVDFEDEMGRLEESDFDDRSGFDIWLGVTEIPDAWEFAVTMPEPQCQSFCEQVMPRFKKLLEEELERESKLG